MLPPKLKTRAVNRARKLKISLGQYIRDALRKSLDTENNGDAEADSLYLDNAVFEGANPRDLSADHDEFLHGDER